MHVLWRYSYESNLEWGLAVLQQRANSKGAVAGSDFTESKVFNHDRREDGCGFSISPKGNSASRKLIASGPSPCLSHGRPNFPLPPFCLSSFLFLFLFLIVSFLFSYSLPSRTPQAHPQPFAEGTAPLSSARIPGFCFLASAQRTKLSRSSRGNL